MKSHTPEQGCYFAESSLRGVPKPEWRVVEKSVPSPIYDADPSAVDAYESAWRLAVESIREPIEGSGLPATHMFFDFNGADAIFAHDSAIMTMFGRYAFRVYDAITTLDNFYAKQHSTGEICREINRSTGEDCWPNVEGDPMTVHLEEPWSEHDGDWSKVKSYKWTRPTIADTPPAKCAVDSMTDHKFEWAELLNYRLTGDTARLALVSKPLEMSYRASRTYLRDTNGLYITDWAGLDNSPRNKIMKYGVDISAQMVYRADYLSKLFGTIGETAKAAEFADEAAKLAELVRRMMWNPRTGFFHDLDAEENFVPLRTIAGFWPIFAEIADKEQLDSLKEHLEDEKLFKAPVMVPSLSRSEPEYSEWGEYYLGGVWPYTNAMIIEGLGKYGEHALARKIAVNYWNAAVAIHKETGTVWEYFAPDHQAPGRSENSRNPGANARKDFAGWGAYPLISTFLERVIGLSPNAADNTLTWRVNELERHGCANFAFGETVVDLVAEARRSPAEKPSLEIKTNRPFALKLIWNEEKQCEETIHVS